MADGAFALHNEGDGRHHRGEHADPLRRNVGLDTPHYDQNHTFAPDYFLDSHHLDGRISSVFAAGRSPGEGG